MNNVKPKTLQTELINYLQKLKIELNPEVKKTIGILSHTFKMMKRVDEELEILFNDTGSYLIKGRRNPNLEIRKNLATTFSTYCKLLRDVIDKSPVKKIAEIENPLDDFMKNQ